MAVPRRPKPGESIDGEPIAESLSVDVCIKECFQFLHPGDVERYKKEFKSQPHDQHQVVHTFRELLFGSYLARNDWRVRAYQKIDGKTPDWSVLGEQGELKGIIDVVNVRPDKATDDQFRGPLRKGEAIPLSGNEAAISKRVYDSIKSKCTGYKDFVESRNIPYIIGLFPQFTLIVETSQVIENLYLPPDGLFLSEELGGYPNVSGLAFLSEKQSVDEHSALWLGYRFEYLPNPHARRPWEFPSGSYCNPLVLAHREHYLKAIANLKAQTDFNLGLMRLFQRHPMAEVYGPLFEFLNSRWPEEAGGSGPQIAC
jgi:hypothetical protein